MTQDKQARIIQRFADGSETIRTQAGTEFMSDWWKGLNRLTVNGYVVPIGGVLQIEHIDCEVLNVDR